MFKSEILKADEEGVIAEDRFRRVELTTFFKRVHCYNCDLTSIYKYRVQEVRRSLDLPESPDEQDHAHAQEVWRTIPRYAQIPETVKCKECGEILGLYTECIY